jgi:hypothetical protein
MQSAEGLKWLNKLKNEPFVAYLKRKVGQWYCEAAGIKVRLGAQGRRKQPADDEEDVPAEGGAGAGAIEEEQGDGGSDNGLPGLALD